MTEPSRIPVIVGIGETIDRACTLQPRALLAEAARAAGADVPGLLKKVDSLDVVSMVSWRYADIARVLAADLGIDPARAAESGVGGEKPVRLLGEAAQRIAAGQSAAALICGAEALRTRAQAAQQGRELDWGPTDIVSKPPEARDFVTAHAARYGLVQPTDIYPLYENATRHAWRQSADEADLESATLWSRYAAAAAANPFAWLGKPVEPAAIIADTVDNRMIAYPYRKLMVANPMVNQGAAILLTSLAAAREAGVAAERIVYVGSGARADEPADFLVRDRYDHSTAQDAVLTALRDLADSSANPIDLYELYSCFPTVPKMARRTLGLGEDVAPSVTGGLTFFGGPANNFMTHAIAAAVRAIRDRTGHIALLYGQGEYVTKHAAILLGDRSFAPPMQMQDVQDHCDRMAGPAPQLLEEYEGPASIESFTIIYGRGGVANYAPIILRTADGHRVVTRNTADDAALVAFLSDRTANPIGAAGDVRRGADGLLHFSILED